jgi:hypothetical protein
MGLEQIIQKSEVIDTPPAHDLANEPEKWQKIFWKHVSTHVMIADLTDKWQRIIGNLERSKSATGLIFAETGYGKTSTAAALWDYAEKRNIVVVPPFMWNNIADMLIATHGWVCHKLKTTRPDLITDLHQEYERLVRSSAQDIANKISQEQGITINSAERIIQSLEDDGAISVSISANRLLDYLKIAVSTLLKADYKGLLILPDEFELFESSNSDIAKNLSELKNLIFPVFQQDSLPIGLVVSTYGRTYSDIQNREPYMLSRFDKPKGSVINLEQSYGKKESGRSFADELWEKLSISCQLSTQEREAISQDVLEALGQFLTHPRTTSLISGPRSVVTTFRQAAKHFSEKKQQYSVFDFFEDYISRRICWNQQEIDTVKAYHVILSQPIVDNEAKKKAIKLLCVFPDGVPPEMFRKHGIEEVDSQAVVQGLLGTHVITQVIGQPTLLNYKYSTETVDHLVEILKELKYNYNPSSPETYRAAVRAFVNYIVLEIFNQSQGASPTGWSGLKKMDTDMEPVFQLQLKGTALQDFPQRELTVHVATEKHQEITGRYRQSQLFVSFVFNVQSGGRNECQIRKDGLYFRFNITQPIDPQEIPKEISKLGDLFLPESVTPILLLRMLDFFDLESTRSQIERLKQNREVGLLKSQICNELIKYFFSEPVKQSALSSLPELETIPIGKNFVERTLAVLIRALFPSYRSIAFSQQWVKALSEYTHYLRKEESLGVRKGVEPKRMVNADVLNMFHIKSHTTFASTYYPDGIWRDLLRVNEIDQNGNTVQEKIEVRSNQTPVAVYFTLHDLESRLLDQLEQSDFSIIVDGKETKAIRLSEFFKQEQEKGYLDEEIEQLIEVLEARGLVDQVDRKGIGYLYLVKTEISLKELQTKFEHLEKVSQLAKTKNFVIQWEPGESLSEIGQLLKTEGIQADELQKDALQQKLRSAEKHFKLQCAEWLKTETDKIQQKRYEIGTLLQTEIPKVLEKGEGFPSVDFSQLLFMDIRSQIKDKYHALPKKVLALQKEIENTLSKKIQNYKENQTDENAIETAGQLREFGLSVNTKIKNLEATREEAQQLYDLFIKWRNVANLIERNRAAMLGIKDREDVRNLIDRLDDEQHRIKQHLADRSLTLVQVLENYEYFTTIVSEIEEEFDQITRRTEEDFIKFRANIEEQLRPLIDKPDIDEQYNPNDEDGCYRRIREKTVEKIRKWVTEPFWNNIRILKMDLLKPKEVFTVEETVRNQAIALEKQIADLEQKIRAVQGDLQPQGIEEKLPKIIGSLLSIKEEGAKIVETNNKIQTQLQCERSDLSSEAQYLLNLIEETTISDFTQLIIQLRESESERFPDTSQIIKSLEELYQHNWININISLSLKQQ